jgi:YwiC-like protein
VIIMERTRIQEPALGDDALLTRAILKGVALPAEHGSWSFILEPIVFGLLIAPSWAGALVALAAMCAFMAHRPLRVTFDSWRKGQRGARVLWARRFALGFVLAATVAASLATFIGDATFWGVLPLVAPVVGVQMVLALSKRGRDAIGEGTGALALAAASAAVVLAGSGTPGFAAAAWLLMAGRSLPAIAYVRARLRQERGKSHNVFWPQALHGLGVLAATGLAVLGMAPWISVAVFVVLLARAVMGLSPSHRQVPPKIVGVQETLWGGMTVLVIALGYRLGAML